MRETTLTVKEWQRVLKRGGGMIPFADRHRIATAIAGKDAVTPVRVLVSPETVNIIEG